MQWQVRVSSPAPAENDWFQRAELAQMAEGVDWRRLEARLRLIYHDVKTEAASRNWNEPSKPWTEFFGRFSSPGKQLHGIANRVVVNSHMYQTNYLLIAGLIFLIYALCRPIAVLIFTIVVATFPYATSPTPLVINGKRVTRQNRLLAFLIAATSLLLLTGVLVSFIQALSVATALILSHACFRHTNVRLKVSHFRNQPSDAW